jgi:DNA repair exonuclease SbcCD ATPase subunit
MILSALTELHTKCWLIAKDHFADLIQYTQTQDTRFPKEANLVITKMEHHSPVEVTLGNLDPDKLSKAIVIAIDGVAQAKQRLKKIELENQEKEEQIRQSEKKAEQEYQAKQQELAIAVQKAAQETQRAELEQEKQKFELVRQRLLFQIEQEKQKLELERQQVALEKERLELFNTRMSYLIEIAGKMVDMLQPHADQSTREMLIQTMLPDLLQLQNGEGLELTLPVPQGSEEKTETKQNG